MVICRYPGAMGYLWSSVGSLGLWVPWGYGYPGVMGTLGLWVINTSSSDVLGYSTSSSDVIAPLLLMFRVIAPLLLML